jgi:nephrocystin-4
MQTDVSLIKGWGRACASHETIPPPLGVIQDLSKPQPFLVQIYDVENSPVPQNSLRFSLTFFHRRSQTFFGRTFVFGSEKMAYFYSHIKEDEAYGIIEIIQVEMAGDVLKRKDLLGWSIIYCLQPKDNTKAQIYKGSPRVLSHIANPTIIPGIALTYSVRIFDELRNAFDLLPPNTICGSHEELPGIEGRFLPNTLTKPIRKVDTTPLYLQNFQIGPATELERKIIEFGQAWRLENFGAEDAARITVQERRLLIGVHNTWSFVGGSSHATAVLLRPNTEGNLFASGITNLGDAFRDEMCAIIFELEYSLDVPKRRGEGVEKLRVTVGWCPYICMREGDVNLPLITGPGDTVGGKMLWESKLSSDLQIYVEISYKTGVVRMPPEIHTHIQEPPPDIERIKAQVAAEKDRKIRELEIQLQNERRRAIETFQAQPLPTKSETREAAIQIEEVKPTRTVAPTQPPPNPNPARQAPPSTAPRQAPSKQSVAEYLSPTYEKPPDYQYLEAVPPIVQAKSTNERAFETAPEGGPRNLSRADKARLVKAGVRGLLDNDETVGPSRPRLDVEASDPLKAAVVCIQFLAFRPPPSGGVLPSRLVFGVQFYTYQHIYSDIALLRQGENSAPWILTREVGTDPELVLKYDVEPPAWDELDFAKYLIRKKLTVEIWDSDSLIHFGSIRVPLVDLVRQGKPSVVVTKEYPVSQELNGESIGSLQLLIRHMGRVQSITTQTVQHPLKIAGGTMQHKRKVRSKQLEISQASVPAPINNEENRKKLRILEWKKSRKENSTSEDWDKLKQLKEVSLVRDNLKPTVLTKALKEYLSSSQKIYARIGQAFTFQYIFRNPYSKEECFTIVSDDPELSVVNSVSEWQWWVSHHDYDRPNEWDMITKDRTVLLHGGESCPLLFKYISWEPKEKTIQVWIHQSQGAQLTCLELEVIPQSAPIDHVFRFYEAENRSVRVCLPPLYSSDMQIERPILHCSLPKAIVQWESEKEISVELRVPTAPNILDFYVQAYSDPYFSDIQATWEVKLHALVGVDVNVTMGQTTGLRLACPGDEARTVKLYSSDIDSVFFPSPHDSAISLLPRSVNSLPIMVRSDTPQIKRIRVHCIDIYHRKIVHAWIIRIESTASTITQVYHFSCPLNTPTDKRIMFTNRSSAWGMFHFRSSHPKVLQLKESRMPLEAGASGYLWISIPGVNESSLAEVCVFANDSEENIFECLLFKISFV